MIAAVAELSDNDNGIFMADHHDIQLPRCFDENPELKGRLMEFLRGQPVTDPQRSVEAVEKFVSGELSWAEIKHIPKSLLKELARVAYLKFKTGDYRKAEILFKGLAVLDHLNWYFRAALGAVFQKQGLFEQAVEEYTIALELHPDELSSRVNRGQCYLKLGEFDAALADFDRVLKMGLDEKDAWRKRASTLSQAVLTMHRET